MIPFARSRLLAAFFVLVLALASACAPKQVAPPPLTLTFLPCTGDYISKHGEPLALSNLLALASDADYVLIGEHHKSACDHNIQQQVVAGLALSEHPPAIGLEMVAVDKNPVLARFLARDIPLDGLEAALEWDQRWGYPFGLFEPLFAMAQDQGLPLAGLNVPKEILAKAKDQGEDSLTEQERAWYPSRVLPGPPEQEEILKAVFGLHEGKADHLAGFLRTQSVWDTMMAEQAVALRAETGRPVVVIAGSGHVEHGWGIAHRLRSLDPGATILLLDGFRAGEFDPEGADAFFHCPPSFDSKLGMILEVRQDRVLVVRVKRGSRADKAGLRPGDAVLAVQGRELESFMDLHRAGKEAFEQDKPLRFTVERHGKKLDIDFGKLGQGE